MTSVLFTGCVLLCYSFVFWLSVFLLSRRPHLLVLSVTAAFFWLLALLGASIVWYIIPPFYESDYSLLPLSFVAIECARYLLLSYFARTEQSFSVVSINAIVYPMVDFYSAMAAGLGFATIHCLLFYGPILSYSLGPAVLYSSTCNRMSSFVLNSLNGLLFSYMHVALMIIALDALRSRTLWKWIPVWLLHASASASTGLNALQDGCDYSLIVLAAIVAATIAWAGKIALSDSYRSKKQA